MQKHPCARSLASAFQWPNFRKTVETWTQNIRNASYLSYFLNSYTSFTRSQPYPHHRNTNENMSSHNIPLSMENNNSHGRVQAANKSIWNNRHEANSANMLSCACDNSVGIEVNTWAAIEDQLTLNELQEKLEHKKRLAEGQSPPHLVAPPMNAFPKVKKEFSSAFSAEQLRVLEKDFQLSDLDQDGLLNGTEIKYWMEKRVHPITERQLKAILVNCDQDQDHALSFREFLLLCQHVQFNDFSRPFHNSQFLGTNKCEQDQMVGKKSKSKSFQSGREEQVSEKEKVSSRKCDNKQLNRITKGTVKEHIQFFNGKIKSAREETELKRKQIENLPKPHFAGGSTNCVEKNSKLENHDNAGFQPPKPPPLPKMLSSQDPPLGSSSQKTMKLKGGDETPRPEGSHSREKKEDSGTDVITGQKSEQAGAAESVRGLTVPPSDSSTELVCFESLSEIQATSTTKPKPVDSGCCNDDKNGTKITSSSESYLDCQDLEQGIDAVQLLDNK